MFYLLSIIHGLLLDQVGHLGARYVTEIRVTPGRPRNGYHRALVSFDGMGRPFRTLLKPVVTHTFQDPPLRLIDWNCAVTGRTCWWTTDDGLPADWSCYVCGADEISANGSLGCSACVEPNTRFAAA